MDGLATSKYMNHGKFIVVFNQNCLIKLQLAWYFGKNSGEI